LQTEDKELRYDLQILVIMFILTGVNFNMDFFPSSYILMAYAKWAAERKQTPVQINGNSVNNKKTIFRKKEEISEIPN
jgi:hypothetical protein